MFGPGEVFVQKFGGSSTASPERIKKIAERVVDQFKGGKRLVLVVSAMGDTTDDFLSLMSKVSLYPEPREVDQLLATGEIVSAALMASSLQSLGIRAKSFNAFNLQIRTDNRFGSAEIKEFGRIRELEAFIDSGGIPIVAGFQGITDDGDLTTLGRGGSDITAVALARELGQKVCEKFTDEDGIYSADPRIIPTAKKIWHLNYDEMAILAKYGNGILHPRSIAYAKESSIRIHVRSSFTREEGSVVGPEGDPEIPVKSIACDKKQAIASISRIRKKNLFDDFLKNQAFFSIMEKEVVPNNQAFDYKIGFRIVETFDALTTLWTEAEKASAEDVLFNSRLVVISVVGCGLKEDIVRRNIRQILLENSKIPYLIREEENNRLSIAVNEDFFEEAIKIFHSCFFESGLTS